MLTLQYLNTIITNRWVMEHLQNCAIELLKQLIATPSFSREEEHTAALIEIFFQKNNILCQRYINNVWAKNKFFDKDKPSILLNSHHDTVKPNPSYTLNPFDPMEKEGKLFGLGSNDAGGCLVSLMATFCYFYAKENLPFNLVIACTAEEEVSGKNGIEALLAHPAFLMDVQEEADFSHKHWCGIVGEPTLMELAIAEKGLLVIDVVAHGKAGHAARDEGDNALYRAMKEIEWFSAFQFPKESPWLGKVKMTVTVIHTENKQHNVVPDVCHYTVDIRIPDCYTHDEVLEIIRQNIISEIMPRSFRLKSSRIETDHPLIISGLALGKEPYGSPTCSDKAFMPFPTLKCGPGNSARSHTADEFIYIDEIKNGIAFYIRLLEQMKL